jgi:2,3-bisphosphoglycerate-dependent phosphoglycerate mutase
MTNILILLRHGESTANADDVFGGWLDFPLTNRGRDQAATAGRLIREAGLAPTAVLTVSETDSAGLTPQRSWRLNERHYGALQGRARTAVRAEFGAELFGEWRRSYHLAPPAIGPDDPTHPRHDPRYAALPPNDLPASESLAAVRRRLTPYWQDAIAADLAAGRVTLVVAHGNSLRALCMHLDGLTPDRVRTLHIPTGVPLRYDLDNTLTPLVSGGVYLEMATQGSH